jgi:hypothetical protein
MFIKKSICNYNAHDLLLATSRLAFVLDAWVIIVNSIINIIMTLHLTEEKKDMTKKFQPIVLGLHDYTSMCSTNNYDTIPRHSWLPFS